MLTSRPGCSSWPDTLTPGTRPREAWNDGFCTSMHCLCSRHGKRLSRRSKPGLGDPQWARRALQREVPDRATFKTTSGAMVAVLRWSSRALPFVALPILRVHQNLELFKRHGFLCRRFPFLLGNSKRTLLDFWMNSMNFDEVIQLQVLKLKALTDASAFVWSTPDREHPGNAARCAPKVHPAADRPPRSVTNLLD
jgi:hypothetical protein